MFAWETGTVRSVYADDIGVVLDDIKNHRSVFGAFYFGSRQVKVINDDMEDTTMVISNIKNYLNVVRVRFRGEAKPCNHLYANFEPDLNVGDLVVVKPAHHDITVAKVEEIIEGDNLEVQREIVAKVNTEAYDNRVAVRKQAAELKAKMEERAKQLQDVALYKMLAENDPAMMELLNEYQALTK